MPYPTVGGCGRKPGTRSRNAASAIGKVRSRIVDLEDGRSAVAQEDLAKLLDLYGVSGKERDTVLALGVEARKRQRRRAYTDLLPGAFQRFADLEASAVEINSYESGVVPGLLQSPGYVRAVIEECDGAWWDSSEAEREQRVAFRLERQARTLDSSGKRVLRFVLTEDSLRAGVGSPEVMREQLRHILRVTGDRDDLCVQVLPCKTYRNPGRGGGLCVFGFGEKGPPVGFSTTLFGPSTYYHDEADTAIMARGFDRLCTLALNAERSRLLIEQIVEDD